MKEDIEMSYHENEDVLEDAVLCSQNNNYTDVSVLV